MSKVRPVVMLICWLVLLTAHVRLVVVTTIAHDVAGVLAHVVFSAFCTFYACANISELADRSRS